MLDMSEEQIRASFLNASQLELNNRHLAEEFTSLCGKLVTSSAGSTASFAPMAEPSPVWTASRGASCAFA